MTFWPFPGVIECIIACARLEPQPFWKRAVVAD
jgi:hypothetical protein